MPSDNSLRNNSRQQHSHHADYYSQPDRLRALRRIHRIAFRRGRETAPERQSTRHRHWPAGHHQDVPRPRWHPSAHQAQRYAHRTARLHRIGIHLSARGNQPSQPARRQASARAGRRRALPFGHHAPAHRRFPGVLRGVALFLRHLGTLLLLLLPHPTGEREDHRHDLLPHPAGRLRHLLGPEQPQLLLCLHQRAVPTEHHWLHCRRWTD